MENQRASIDLLVGARHVTKRGNVVQVEKIGDGALRALYRDRPTPGDIDEFEAFVRSVLESLGPVRITRSIGRAAEAGNYEAWKRLFEK
jgi:hypothetical protein